MLPTCMIYAHSLAETDRVDLEGDDHFEISVAGFTEQRAHSARQIAAGSYLQPDSVDTDDDTGRIVATFDLVDDITVVIQFPPEHMLTVVR